MIQLALRSSIQAERAGRVGEVGQDGRQRDRRDHQLEPGQEDAGPEHDQEHDRRASVHPGSVVRSTARQPRLRRSCLPLRDPRLSLFAADMTTGRELRANLGTGRPDSHGWVLGPRMTRFDRLPKLAPRSAQAESLGLRRPGRGRTTRQWEFGHVAAPGAKSDAPCGVAERSPSLTHRNHVHILSAWANPSVACPGQTSCRIRTQSSGRRTRSGRTTTGTRPTVPEPASTFAS